MTHSTKKIKKNYS